MESEKVHILLIEDNTNDAELAIRAFRKKAVACKLVHLKDGEEALNYIFCMGEFVNRDINDLPGIICLDLKMPKVDGVEVLSKLKADERTKSIPVVVLTSSKEEKDLRETYLLGANSYVVKPVGFEEYIKTVSELGSYWMIINQQPNQF